MYVIRWRRGSASEWAADDPILAPGEPGYVIDTNRFKIGDGVTAWSSLPYASVGPSGPIPSITGSTDAQKIDSVIAALVALGLATDNTT